MRECMNTYTCAPDASTIDGYVHKGAGVGARLAKRQRQSRAVLSQESLFKLLHCGFRNVDTVYEPQDVANKNQPTFSTHTSRHQRYHLSSCKI